MSGLHTYTCFKDAESHKSLGISVQFSDTCLTSESTPTAPLRDNDLPITSTINVHVKSARNVESSDRLPAHTNLSAREVPALRWVCLPTSGQRACKDRRSGRRG